MKFKIDENLPVELAEVLATKGHDAVTAVAQGLQGKDDKTLVNTCLQEERALVTLDLDFADIRAYPPQDFPGFVVFRLSRQDRDHLMSVLREVIPLMEHEPPGTSSVDRGGDARPHSRCGAREMIRRPGHWHVCAAPSCLSSPK